MKKNTDSNTTALSLGPIQKRILAITLSGIILVCLVIGTISFYIFRTYLRDEMVATTQTSLSNLSETISSYGDNIFRLARYCQGSNVISDYIESSPNPGSILSINTYNRLYEEYQNNEANSYIPRVAVIAGNNYLQTCMTTYSTTTNLAFAVPELPFFEQLINSPSYDFSIGIINDPFSGGLPKPVIPIIRPITYKFNSSTLGYLYMEFSADLFINSMKHYYLDDESSLYLVMENHLYRFENGSLSEIPNNHLDIGKIRSAANSSNIIRNVRITGNSRMTLVSVPLRFNGCYLVQGISPTTIRNQLFSFTVLLIVIFASVIAIGVALTFAMNHYIRKPINSIRQKIKSTSDGDFTRDPSIEWPHELGEIGKGINDLSESVNNLLNTKLQDEKQKRDLEYRVLQNQINPHFLYNTLNSIKMMASIQGATGISEMTSALASLLRSISKGTSLLVPISEELSLVNDYFTIQNYRYGGMITFGIDIKDPEIVKSRILKFTLQPLVENAIFHGLEPKGGIGNISISLSFTESAVHPENRDILIEVTDDGVGISEEKINRIMAGTTVAKADFFKEIGIKNVRDRLKYEFGDSYGIFIESEVGQYTKMKVLIPENRTE